MTSTVRQSVDDPPLPPEVTDVAVCCVDCRQEGKLWEWIDYDLIFDRGNDGRQPRAQVSRLAHYHGSCSFCRCELHNRYVFYPHG